MYSTVNAHLPPLSRIPLPSGISDAAGTRRVGGGPLPLAVGRLCVCVRACIYTYKPVYIYIYILYCTVYPLPSGIVGAAGVGGGPLPVRGGVYVCVCVCIYTYIHVYILYIHIDITYIAPHTPPPSGISGAAGARRVGGGPLPVGGGPRAAPRVS